MAHSLSAQKRIRQSAKRMARNKARKAIIKDETKAFKAALVVGDKGQATAALNTLVSTLDRVKTKSTLHRNTAARRRSRLTKQLNKLGTAAATVVAAKPTKAKSAAPKKAGKGKKA